MPQKKTETELERHVRLIFRDLNKPAAAQSMKPPLSLSLALEKAISPSEKRDSFALHLDPALPALFATAAVEIWMRAIHSFLISAWLTDSSAVWASVSGYYSSHYCMRGFAHLCGYFQLFHRRRIIRLERNGDPRSCRVEKKQGSDREHTFYWKIVNAQPEFSDDPLFTDNPEKTDTTDVGHRSRANYADHINKFQRITPPAEEAIRARVQQISTVQFEAPPIPRMDKFPDIVNVQVVAYHRIVRFRRFLDEILGIENRFWTAYRNPSWLKGLISFQLVEGDGLRALHK